MLLPLSDLPLTLASLARATLPLSAVPHESSPASSPGQGAPAVQTWIPLLGQALAVIITALGGLLVTRRTGQAALLNETIVNLRGELTDAKATLAARTQERDDAERRLRDAQFQIETRDERIGRLIDRLDGQAVTQPPSTQPPSPPQGSAP